MSGLYIKSIFFLRFDVQSRSVNITNIAEIYMWDFVGAVFRLQ